MHYRAGQNSTSNLRPTCACISCSAQNYTEEYTDTWIEDTDTRRHGHTVTHKEDTD